MNSEHTSDGGAGAGVPSPSGAAKGVMRDDRDAGRAGTVDAVSAQPAPPERTPHPIKPLRPPPVILLGV